MIGIGLFLMYYYNIFEKVNHGDLTKISFGILVMFIFFSARIGVLTYKIRSISINDIGPIEWFAEKFVTLGMIGTVFGFLFTLDTVFCGIDAGNVSSMQAAISDMAQGMGTALYTTAAGLVCSFLLKLQIYNLEMGLSCKTQGF